jgi:hypothetical protein
VLAPNADHGTSVFNPVVEKKLIIVVVLIELRHISRLVLISLPFETTVARTIPPSPIRDDGRMQARGLCSLQKRYQSWRRQLVGHAFCASKHFHLLDDFQPRSSLDLVHQGSLPAQTYRWEIGGQGHVDTVHMVNRKSLIHTARHANNGCTDLTHTSEVKMKVWHSRLLHSHLLSARATNHLTLWRDYTDLA